MSTFGKNTSIVKRKLAEERTPNVISKTITFAHEADGFQNFIDFTNLKVPSSMFAKGFANPPQTVLPFLRLYRQNLQVYSTYKGDLKDYEDYIVVNNYKLALQSITTEPGEIFIIKLVLPNNVDVDSLLKSLSSPEETYNRAKYGVHEVFTKTSDQLNIITDVLSHVARKNRGDTFESVDGSTTEFITALTSGVSLAFIGGVLLPDGRVFCVPFDAGNAKIYDPVTNTQSTTALTKGVSYAFTGGVLLPDGRVFCVPRYASVGKIYDPVTNTQSTTALTSDVSDAFAGGVLLPDGRVFCVPRNASYGKIYDPVTNTQSTTALVGGLGAFWGGVLLPDGRVFCVPYDATVGKIYDPVTNTQSTTALTSGGFAGGVLLPDGRVFCVPNSASNAKIYDPVTNIQSITTLTATGTEAFYGGILLPDGRVFCVPYNASAGKIYNPITNTQSVTALTGGTQAFVGGVLLPDGRVFCVPFSATSGKILNGPWTRQAGNNYQFPKAIMLSAFLNKF